ncbi:hypothetical protein WG66_005179 [Moniliophthora roreri]|nr:hypothetical protein WG66_005179 [Moniliophthora roreri]
MVSIISYLETVWCNISLQSVSPFFSSYAMNVFPVLFAYYVWRTKCKCFPAPQFVINGGLFHGGPIAPVPDEKTRGACPREELLDRPPFETYTRCLLPKGLGHPLWYPSVTEDLPHSYRKVGISIGDVVALDDQGGYEYFFNILLPEDDERNLGRVPEGFTPLIGLEPNIRRNPSQHLPGSFIAGPMGEISLDPLYYNSQYRRHHTDIPSEFGCGFQFTSHGSEGAILILPEGGMREDHRNEEAFHGYAARHAKLWYRHINGTLGRRLSADALILVTGVDKTSAWGVASFSGAVPGTVHLEMVPSREHAKYRFRRHAHATARTGPSWVDERLPEDISLKNQCIFLRGVRVVIRSTVLPSLLSVKTQDVRKIPFEDLLTRSNFIPFRSRTPRNDKLKRAPSPPPSYTVSTERVPPSTTVYDPSTMIAKHLLNVAEDADVALVRDSQIFTLIGQDQGCMPRNEELLERMQQHFAIVTSDGIDSLDFASVP